MGSVSSERLDFVKDFLEKNVTIEGLNNLLRQASEFEVLTPINDSYVRHNLGGIGRGFASDKQKNDGNGWNADVHQDGYSHRDGSFSQYIGGKTYYATEASTSPLESTTFNTLRNEYSNVLPLLMEASENNIRHNHGGSCHVHTCIGYMNFWEEDSFLETRETVVTLPTKFMYRNIGLFIARFYPVLKWLSMTNINGARGAEGNRYDCLSDDDIFNWATLLNRYGRHTINTDDYLHGMGRNSILRIYNSDVLHWENRILDCNLSPTLMSAWLCLNRAITLLAYDFANKGYTFKLSPEQLFESQEHTRWFGLHWKRVDREYIAQEYKVMMSYLYKYFHKSNSLGAIQVFDKLVEKPIPQYLEEKELVYGYKIELLDGVWASRNRQVDNELRESFLEAIRTMSVPIADSLKGFQQNIAEYLGVEIRQITSLYQMFKREFERGQNSVDLQFNAGRLIDMGD